MRIGLAAALLIACGQPPPALRAEPVAVRHVQGSLHGFLILSTADGQPIASGDLVQSPHGDHVTSRLVFQFKDGSVQEETVDFSQRQAFKVLSDHLVQKGPAFQHPMDVTIDGASGRVTVRTRGDDGKDQVFDDRLALPADLANGLLLTLLTNLPRGSGPFTVSMVAAAPKPRLVKLRIAPAGKDSLTIAGSSRQATRYDVKVEIGGIAGLVAPLLGKQPPDTHVWVLEGEVPAFVKAEGPLYFGGPPWRIELASPAWPIRSAARR